MLWTALPARAANFNVATEGQLSSAISSAGNGDTITFTANITLSGNLPVIAKSLTFNGGNHILSGNNQYRGLFVQSGTVVINDIKIADARADGGNGGSGEVAAAMGIPTPTEAVADSEVVAEVAARAMAAAAGSAAAGVAAAARPKRQEVFSAALVAPGTCINLKAVAVAAEAVARAWAAPSSFRKAERLLSETRSSFPATRSQVEQVELAMRLARQVGARDQAYSSVATEP